MNTKIIIGVIIAVLIIGITYLVIQQNAENEKHELVKSKNQYLVDSARVFTLDKEKAHPLSTLQFHYLEAKKHLNNPRLNYKQLLDYLDKLKFKHTYGKYYFDEYSKELIRKTNEKTITLTFAEKDELKDKFKSESIYKGYKTRKNRKAHKLQKKYGWSNSDCDRV